MGGAAFSEGVERLLAEAGEQVAKRGVKEVYNYVIKRGSQAVRDAAPGLGDALTNLIVGTQEKYRQIVGGYEADMLPYVKRVEKYPDVMKNFYDYFSGAKTHPDPAVKELAEKVRMDNLMAYAQAGKAGIKIGPPNPDNWSRKWPYGQFEGKNREKAIARLIKNGDAKNEDQAVKLLDFMSGKSKVNKDYNLEAPRKYDVEGWRKDFYSQTDAMRSKLWRIIYAQNAGPKAERVSQALSAIRQQYGQSAYQVADSYVDQMFRKVGKNYRPYSSLERGINSVNAARFLGMIGVRHASQTINAMVFGARMRPILKGLYEMIAEASSAEEWGLRAGALTNSAFQEMKRSLGEMYGSQSLGSWVIRASGFPTVMKYNRIFASVYGRELAKDLVDEYAVNKSPTIARKLAQLGIDADGAVERGLSLQDLYRASSRTSELTMFNFDVEHLPLAWRDSPLHRLLSQYKPWIYMQSVFLKDNVLKPAVKFAATGGREGEIRPLVYMALLFPTFGEVTADLYSLLTRGSFEDRPPMKYWVDRAVENISFVGGFGILHDLVYTLTSWQSGLQIPAWSEMSDIWRAITSKHHMKEASRQIPIAGRLIYHQMHPKSKPPKGYREKLRKGYLTKHLNRFLRDF
jgi:hypothetical protein